MNSNGTGSRWRLSTSCIGAGEMQSIFYRLSVDVARAVQLKLITRPVGLWALQENRQRERQQWWFSSIYKAFIGWKPKRKLVERFGCLVQIEIQIGLLVPLVYDSRNALGMICSEPVTAEDSIYGSVQFFDTFSIKIIDSNTVSLAVYFLYFIIDLSQENRMHLS